MNQLCRVSGWKLLFNAAISRQASRLGMVRSHSSGYNDDMGPEKGDVTHTSAEFEVPIPPYTPRTGETVELKRARLVYQSRKRGMLENGIILSTYASRYLAGMTEEHLDIYDKLINQPTNDWDIFDWIVKRKPVPEEYDSDVLRHIQEHAQNKEMEERFIQPPLY